MIWRFIRFLGRDRCQFLWQWNPWHAWAKPLVSCERTSKIPSGDCSIWARNRYWRCC